MPARLIDGTAFAASLRDKVRVGAADLASSHGVVPGLAVVLVGDDPASQVYVRNKAARTVEAGMRSFEHRLPVTTGEDELLALVARLNADPAVHGILVQLPLPPQIREARVLTAVDPAKDVDGFHPINAGSLASGKPTLVPCTPLACVILAKDVLGSLDGLDAVVIGRSNIVGKPVAQLLLQENCTVTIAHSKTRDLPAVVRRADTRGGCRRPARDDPRRLDQAGRHGDRRRHQSRAGDGARQDPARRRRRLRGGIGGRRRHHARAGGRRAD